MNILLVSDISAEEANGGAERVLIHHVRAFRNAGFNITILTRQPDPSAPMTVKLDGGLLEHRLPFSGDKGMKGMVELLTGARKKTINSTWLFLISLL